MKWMSKSQQLGTRTPSQQPAYVNDSLPIESKRNSYWMMQFWYYYYYNLISVSGKRLWHSGKALGPVWGAWVQVLALSSCRALGKVSSLSVSHVSCFHKMGGSDLSATDSIAVQTVRDRVSRISPGTCKTGGSLSLSLYGTQNFPKHVSVGESKPKTSQRHLWGSSRNCHLDSDDLELYKWILHVPGTQCVVSSPKGTEAGRARPPSSPRLWVSSNDYGEVRGEDVWPLSLYIRKWELPLRTQHISWGHLGRGWAAFPNLPEPESPEKPGNVICRGGIPEKQLPSEELACEWANLYWPEKISYVEGWSCISEGRNQMSPLWWHWNKTIHSIECESCL